MNGQINEIRGLKMKTLTAADVQSQFGSIANIVSGGEPIAVTQQGTPTLMILPYDMGTEALRSYLARQLVQLMDDAPVSPSSTELSLDQVNQMVHELRA